MEYMSLAARNFEWTNIQTKNHHYRRFRADLAQFTELLIITRPLSQRTKELLDIQNKFIQYQFSNHNCPEPIENLYFMTQEDVTQPREKTRNLSYYK